MQCQPPLGLLNQQGLITRLQQGGGIGSVMDIGGNGGSGSWIQVTESGNLAANYKLLLNPNGGNVGIGTTSPGGKLTIEGTQNSLDSQLKITASGQVSQYMGGSSAVWTSSGS